MTGAQPLVMEDKFVKEVIDDRAKGYVSALLQNVQTELRTLGNVLPNGRAAYAVMMLRPVVVQQMEWLSLHTSRNDTESVTMGDMYRFLGVLFLSHLTNISQPETIRRLEQAGIPPPPFTLCRSISSRLQAYHPSLHAGAYEGGTWNAQHDATRFVAELERTAYEASRRLFYVPSWQFLTLDDELMGTRSRSNPVKALSVRKADREGQMSDVLADALFRLTIDGRLHRRGESQIESVTALLRNVKEVRGELSSRNAVVTADRGYSRPAFVELMSQFGLSSIFIMPDHLVSVHPFVGASHMQVGRYDVAEEEIEIGVTEDRTLADDGEGSAVGSDGLQSLQYFVIEDDGELGFGFFSAERVSQARNVRSRACAVREPSRASIAKLLRVQYDLPDLLATKLLAWVATPLGGPVLNDITEAAPGSLGTKLLQTLRTQCSILTRGQRCADWFVLRRFRLTATTAAKVLLDNGAVRDLLRMRARVGTERTREHNMELLRNAWFSTRRSTESMLRGSTNEQMVSQFVSCLAMVECVAQVGLEAIADKPYFSASPDGLLAVDLRQVDAATGWPPCRHITSDDGVEYAVATLEIKTGVSDASNCDAIAHSRVAPYISGLDSEKMRRIVPPEHAAQLLHQCYVMNINLAMYICASETAVLYWALIHVSNDLLQRCGTALMPAMRECLPWAHTQRWTIPAFVNNEDRRLFASHKALWVAVNCFVGSNGPLPPIKLFRHGILAFYSKTKGGVDGVTQYRALLRASTSTMPWEQKVVVQTLKTLLVNAFLPWRLREVYPTSHPDARSTVTSIRCALNRTQSFGDFVSVVAEELIAYGSSLDRCGGGGGAVLLDESSSLGAGSSGAVARLQAMVARNKRKRVEFFNTPDGKLLRLQLQTHDPRHMHTSKWCALCGTYSNRSLGHRSSYKCSLCTVYLCTRRDGPSSCWSVWHTSNVLPSVHGGGESNRGSQSEDGERAAASVAPIEGAAEGMSVAPIEAVNRGDERVSGAEDVVGDDEMVIEDDDVVGDDSIVDSV